MKSEPSLLQNNIIAFRTVYEIYGDARVRLQAPDGWVRLACHGSRILLRDASCSTPIFVEPLPQLEDVDVWIDGVASGGKRVSGHQRSSAPEARRFVLTLSSRGGSLERAYRIQRVRSGARTSGIWVVASVDLDGDRKRGRHLGSIFPPLAETPNLPSGSGLRQYLESNQRKQSGFTLKLPRSHAIADFSKGRFLIHDEHDEALGWMTVEQVGSQITATTEHESTLLASLGEAGQLALSLSGGCSAGRRMDFLRRIQSDFRVWKDRFEATGSSRPA